MLAGRKRCVGGDDGQLARQWAGELLARANDLPWDRLTDELAERLLARDITNWGWVIDIGVWGPSPYRAEARTLLEGLREELAEGEASTSEASSGPIGHYRDQSIA